MGLIEQGGQIFRKKDNARERIFVSLCLPFIPDYGFRVSEDFYIDGETGSFYKMEFFPQLSENGFED